MDGRKQRFLLLSWAVLILTVNALALLRDRAGTVEGGELFGDNLRSPLAWLGSRWLAETQSLSPLHFFFPPGVAYER